MGATLEDLPAELICTLANLLNKQDALAFRLTSRQLERYSFETFARRFFRKKGFLISPLALETLQRIAENAQLARHVQHVWFNPDYFTFTQFEPSSSFQDEDQLDHATSSTVLLDDRSFQAYSRGLEDHRELLRPDRLTPILQETFERLTNLRTVGMRRSEDHAAYGWSRLAQAVGHDPRVIGPSFNYIVGTMSRPCTLYVSIIRALARAERKVQRLYTDAIELDNINSSFMPAEIVQAACAHLQYLEINIFDGDRVPHEDQLDDRQSTAEMSQESEQLWVPGSAGEGLLQVLKAMPRLQEVALQVLPTVPPKRSMDFLFVLRVAYAHRLFKKIADGVQLSHLQRVKLERFTAAGPEFWSFFAPSAQRLTSLKLREVCLKKSDDNQRPWQSFFEMLTACCPELSSILFHDLSRLAGIYDERIVLFEPPEPFPGLADEADAYRRDYVPGVHCTLMKATGKARVSATLGTISHRHWHRRLRRRIAELDGDWHTDTSDEDW